MAVHMNHHTFPLSILGVTNEFIITVCSDLYRFLVYILANMVKYSCLLMWKVSWLMILVELFEGHTMCSVVLAMMHSYIPLITFIITAWI